MQIGKQKFPYSGVKDGVTRGIVTIDYAHHEIHDGTSFHCWYHADKSIGTDLDLGIITPNTSTWSHLIFAFENESETDIILYESANFVTGSTITIYNSNRNSAITSGMLVSHTPTLITTGTTSIIGWHSGSGRGAGSQVRAEDEILLKQNTKYLFRLTATAAGWIAVKLGWYELFKEDIIKYLELLGTIKL
jgi:hypothetical protein